MSRMATSEYIGARRRAYATADRAKRIRILDEVCETTGYERKYANRLLTGSRKFFCPCRMLVEKRKRDGGKGYACRYNTPRTPFQRILDEHVLSPEQESALRAYRARLSGMDLYRRVRRRLRKIRRMQEAYGRAKRAGLDVPSFAARPALALRATPSGTAGLRREGARHGADSPCRSPK